MTNCNNIFVKRIGHDNNSFMITTDLIETYDCYETIYFNNGSLIKSNKNVIENNMIIKKNQSK